MTIIISPPFLLQCDVLIGAVVTICILAAVLDVRSQTIPNALPIAVLGLGVVSVEFGGATASLGSGAIAMAVAFGCGITFWLVRVWGGGDVKLLAACAFWVGVEDLASFFLVTVLAGGIVAIGFLGCRWMRYRFTEKQDAAWSSSANSIPYGPAIATGFTMTLILRCNGSF